MITAKQARTLYESSEVALDCLLDGPISKAVEDAATNGNRQVFVFF